MSEATKKPSPQANSYVVVSKDPGSTTMTSGTVIGAWSNKDKAVRQAFETQGPTLIHVFNPVTGVLIETITKG